MSALPDERLWKVKEVAGYLGYSPWTIYQLVKRQSIPYIKLPSGDLRFDRAEIQAWKSRLSGGPTEDEILWDSTDEKTPPSGGSNTSQTGKRSKNQAGLNTSQISLH